MTRQLLTAFLFLSTVATHLEAAVPKKGKAPVKKTAAKPSAKAEPVRLLYAHSAGSGTLRPLANRPGSYRVSFSDVAPVVIYFSDRPARLAGHIPVKEFIERIGFGKESNPNAVIEISEGAKGEDVLVVELSNPAYDHESNTLAFDATPLKTPREGLAAWSVRADKTIPATFGAATMFIDDSTCSDDRCSTDSDCCPALACKLVLAPRYIGSLGQGEVPACVVAATYVPPPSY